MAEKPSGRMWLATAHGAFSISRTPNDVANGAATIHAPTRKALRELRAAHLPEMGPPAPDGKAFSATVPLKALAEACRRIVFGLGSMSPNGHADRRECFFRCVRRHLLSEKVGGNAPSDQKTGKGKKESAKGEAALKNASLDQDELARLEEEALAFFGPAMSESDYAEAEKRLRAAASSGSQTAMYNLAMLLCDEDNPRRDAREGLDWYQRSAALGESDAMHNLGCIHFYGEDVEQDDNKALDWFGKAAAKGDADSMFMLGRMHNEGRGTSPDGQKALHWFIKAADAGDVVAMYFAGLLHQLGEAVPRNHEEARRWYRRGAELGDACCKRNLGGLLINGQGGEMDTEGGINFLREAAEGDDALAMCQLADIYRAGVIVQQDMEESVKWYRLAAARGMEEAWQALDEMGRGND